MTPESTPSPLDSASDPPAAAAPFEYPTWEDDETTATAVYRALFVLISASFLAYAQWHAPNSWIGTIGQNWGRWVSTSVIFNFLLPLGIIWMFFGQGLVFQDWLKDQKHNAWNYGWNFSQWKRHLKLAAICWVLFLPFLIYYSRLPDVQSFYASYLPVVSSPRDWAFMLSTLVLYMFCWEWFFRGYVLFGSAQGFGLIAAILLQTILFGCTHAGKPPLEMWSAFGGGLVLGTLAWREKSIFPAFLIHTLIHVTLAILVHI